MISYFKEMEYFLLKMFVKKYLSCFLKSINSKNVKSKNDKTFKVRLK